MRLGEETSRLSEHVKLKCPYYQTLVSCKTKQEALGKRMKG